MSEIDQSAQAGQASVPALFEHYFGRRLPIRFDATSQLIIHTVDEQRLMLDQHELGMSLHLLEHGLWEEQVRNVIARVLGEGGTFVDVGANIGVHALLAAALIGTKGKVLAFEPSPRIAGILRKNIEINNFHDRIAVSTHAVADLCETRTFQYFPQRPAMSGFRIAQGRLDEFRGAAEEMTVEVTTLDAAIAAANWPQERRVDLLKIDVEGFEFDVLRGAAQTIAESPDLVVCVEFSGNHSDEVRRGGSGAGLVELLQGQGYEPLEALPHRLLPLSFEALAQHPGGDFAFARPHSRHHAALCAESAPPIGRAGTTEVGRLWEHVLHLRRAYDDAVAAQQRLKEEKDLIEAMFHHERKHMLELQEQLEGTRSPPRKRTRTLPPRR